MFQRFAFRPSRHRETAPSGASGRRRPWLRFASLQGTFLAIIVPMVLLITSGFFALTAYFDYREALENVARKQARMMATQAIILAEPVARRDETQVALLVAAMIADPDIVAVGVLDADSRPIATFGEPLPAAALRGERFAGVRREVLTFVADRRTETVGHLLTQTTDRRASADLRRRLQGVAILTGLLTLAVVFAVNIGFRLTLGEPLRRLLGSIRRSGDGDRGVPVDWESRDELGQVIAAFNDMQARQARYEARLRTVNETLELRVAERTAELVTARNAAEQASRAKDVFLANISHELRTPLNAVIGFGDLIANQAHGPTGDERYLDYAGNIARSGRHLLDLINDLLTYSKIEAGHMQLEETPTSIADTIDQAVGIVRAAGGLRDRHVDVAVPDDMPPVNADTRRILQILINLVSNAGKFTHSDGHIRLSAGRDADGAWFKVDDDGIGLSAEEIEIALSPFMQVDASFNRRFEGTGLGLPLARRLAELHGGCLTIDSAAGEGTSVKVRLPAHRLLLG